MDAKKGDTYLFVEYRLPKNARKFAKELKRRTGFGFIFWSSNLLNMKIPSCIRLSYFHYQKSQFGWSVFSFLVMEKVLKFWLKPWKKPSEIPCCACLFFLLILYLEYIWTDFLRKKCLNRGCRLKQINRNDSDFQTASGTL